MRYFNIEFVMSKNNNNNNNIYQTASITRQWAPLAMEQSQIIFNSNSNHNHNMPASLYDTTMIGFQDNYEGEEQEEEEEEEEEETYLQQQQQQQARQEFSLQFNENNCKTNYDKYTISNEVILEDCDNLTTTTTSLVKPMKEEENSNYIRTTTSRSNEIEDEEEEASLIKFHGQPKQIRIVRVREEDFQQIQNVKEEVDCREVYQWPIENDDLETIIENNQQVKLNSSPEIVECDSLAYPSDTVSMGAIDNNSTIDNNNGFNNCLDIRADDKYYRRNHNYHNNGFIEKRNNNLVVLNNNNQQQEIHLSSSDDLSIIWPTFDQKLDSQQQQQLRNANAHIINDSNKFPLKMTMTMIENAGKYT